MDIDCAQPLLGHAVARESGHEIVGAGCGVDEAGAGDSHLTAEGSPAPKIVRHRCDTVRRVYIVTFPEGTSAGVIGIDGIDTVVLSGEDDDVVSSRLTQ